MEPAWTDARSVFLSDLHLGWKYSKPASLIHLLSECSPDYLYLVGDTFEWFHSSDKNADHCLSVIDLLGELSANGTTISLIPGNHDAQLAENPTFFDLDVRSSFIHRTVNGESYLVSHGDVFDHHRPQHLSAIEQFGSWMYPNIIALGDSLSKFGIRPGGPELHWCSRWKRNSKRAERHIQAFEEFMAGLAEQHQCHGVICGHIHRPAHRRIKDIWYVNCGDWVEHCSYVIENRFGELELHRMESRTLKNNRRVKSIRS